MNLCCVCGREHFGITRFHPPYSKNPKRYYFCSTTCSGKNPMQWTKAENSVLASIIEGAGEYLEKVGKPWDEWEYEDAEGFVKFILESWFKVAPGVTGSWGSDELKPR